MSWNEGYDTGSNNGCVVFIIFLIIVYLLWNYEKKLEYEKNQPVQVEKE